MRAWSVANQKGGVGKTTTTVALGGLAADQGRRVLMIDLDPHGSLSTYFGHDPDSARSSVFTLFEERRQLTPGRIRELIQPTKFERLHVLPSATALATLERHSVGQEGMGLVLTRALTQIYDDYDLVLIDTPPLLGVLMVNALAAAHRLIMPVQTEYLALKGLERMVNTLKMMSKSRQNPLEYHVVPVMFDRRTQASVSSLLTIRNTYPDHVWPGMIPVDTKFRDASKAGIPPHRFEPDSRGADAYRSLYKWLIRKEPVVATASAMGGRG
ncbi:ParA family protein [Marinimicrobium sp. ARAG 43.8]|uniref:ParA family protein n=1 Tax=Marinimicrobium sp. ARAG 43.8 TaxID=3418719 RepID=UPI003CE9154C